MEKLLDFAMCGSEGEECNPYELTAPLEVQKILLLINSTPKTIPEISRDLGIPEDRVSNYLENLKRCGLVEEINGKFKPNFAIFTLKDQKVLKPLISKLIGDTVDIIVENMDRVRNLTNNLFIVSKRGLRFKDLEYIIVGAITLDYIALDVLSEESILIKSKEMPGGGQYVFAAFETGFIDLKEAWMWGHNGVFGKYWFSSHGKIPPGGSRKAFPDIAWSWYIYGMSLKEIEERMVEIGRILEELMYNDMSFHDLVKILNIDRNKLIMNLTLLRMIDYVVPIRVEGMNIRIRLNIPVFTHEDYKQLSTLAREMIKSLALRIRNRYNMIRKYYEKTSPARHDIPLEEAFNHIYHIVFERALDKLIKDNVIPEPPLRPDMGRYSVFLVLLRS